jgi:4-amino-4-deoxychorismate lyase
LLYWYNGELIQSQTLQLQIDDPGLLYGATVFTTLRVYDNSLDTPLTHFAAHCDRLRFSLETFGWELPNWKYLREGASILIKQYPILRITIFPDGREWITGRFLPNNLTEKQEKGIICAVCTQELFRSLPEHKTGNYLSPWLARNRATNLIKGEDILGQEKDGQEKVEEGILVDKESNWLETSTGNLWGWRDGSWWTPPIKAGILPGIVRLQLINYLKQQQQQVLEEPWTKELVKGFDALGYSNCVVEIIPIHRVIDSNETLEYNPHHRSLEQIRRFFLL